MTALDLVPAAQAIARAAIYLTTIWVIGALTTLAVVLPRAPLSSSARATVSSIVWRWAHLGALAVLLAYLLRFYVQLVDAYLVLWPTWYSVYMLLFWTLGWGTGVMAQWAIAFVVWGTTLRLSVRHPRSHRHWRAWVMALLIGCAVPLTGHAIAHGGAGATLVQGLHVVAIGAWLGCLAVIVAVWRRRLLSDGDIPGVIRTFSTPARWSVGVLAVSGVAAMFTHLDAPGDVVRTTYGLVLFAKLAAFSGAASLGWWHWRTLESALDDPVGIRRFRRTVLIELACGVIAVVLVGVLTGLPRPGDFVP